MEIWKDIEGYEGLYQVSNLGRVRSLDRYSIRKDGSKVFAKGVLFSKRICNKGYFMVDFRKDYKKKSFRVHQLVAMAFLNHKPSGHKIVVDHIDNNRANNKLNNIQVITARENVSKERRGRSIYTGVCFRKDRNRWEAYITINKKRKRLGMHKTEIEASNAYQKALKEHLSISELLHDYS